MYTVLYVGFMRAPSLLYVLSISVIWLYGHLLMPLMAERSGLRSSLVYRSIRVGRYN